jgi:hypothetical protein
MAARLMCHKEAKCSLLCDEKSYNMCLNTVEFLSLGQTKVKGKSYPISIYRPLNTKDEKESRENRMDLKNAVDMIGRSAERDRLKQLLAGHAQRLSPKIIIVEADEGQGLSTINDFCKQEAIKTGSQVV